MGLELNTVFGTVEITNFLENIFLAILVIRIGWRFTNIRVVKDLVLEEGINPYIVPVELNCPELCW